MKSAWKASRMTILAVVLTGVPLLSIGKAESLDTVKGHYCYTYGDETTPAQAKKRALVLARERAAESYRVFITNSTKIENFQLKEDIIQSVSAELLQNVQIIKEEEKDRKICIDIKAEIDPTSAQAEITQRLNQRELIEEEKKIPLEKANPAFGLRIWVNKENRQYEEGEHLIVYVQSEQDTYLKLDYCQADGTVVHMVPNMFREATIIEKGKTYVFGGDNSLERFIIQPPFGDEYVKALASTNPFPDYMQPNQMLGNCWKYKKSQDQGLNLLRGLGIKPGASIVLLKSISHAVLEHRKTLKE